MKYRGAFVLIAGLAACVSTPRSVDAQSTPVETLPPTDSTIPRSPFDVAAPNMQAARALVGCYAVTLGPWSNPRAHGGSVPMPPQVDLLADRHTRIYIGFGLVAGTPGFSVERKDIPPAWSPVGRDSLQVRVWGNGTSTVFLFLRRHSGNELRGTARYFTDGLVVDSTGRWLWETYPAATASLRSAPCGSPQAHQR